MTGGRRLFRIISLLILFASVWDPAAGYCAGSAIGTIQFGNPNLYIGWQTEELGHVSHDLHARGTLVHGLIHSHYRFRQPGFWVGLSEGFSLGNRLKAAIEGWLLLSSRSESPSQYADDRWGGDVPDTGVGRTWEVQSTQGWFLDTYFWAGQQTDSVSSWWSPTAGVRYDFYYRRLGQLSAMLLPSAGPTDQMDITVKTFVPYVGINCGTTGQKISTTLRLIGSPMVLGSLSHKETYGSGGFRDEASFPFDVPRGYWGELFLSVHTGERNSKFGMGGFLKMTTMSLNSSSQLTTSRVAGGSESAEYDLIYRRMVYTIGLRFSVGFASPL